MNEGEDRMMDVEDVADSAAGRGFEKVHVLHSSTYKDNSTVIICPTRGAIHSRAASALYGMIAPMNQKRIIMYVVGAEVGDAYNSTIKNILENPELSKWKYVLTVEDDNIPPPDGHIKLLEAIDEGPYDGVGGLYFTKGDYQMPMAYGDVENYRKTGILDFKPLDIREHLKAGAVIPVNGIAMGFSLYRMDMFREIEPPWFQTVAEWIPDRGVRAWTQDLSFCEKALSYGKKFAVHCGVKVGHLDPATGIVYALIASVLPSLFSLWQGIFGA